MDRLDVLVIGGGQAGLAMGYHLARIGVRFRILDGGDRIGDTWRRRWDSLELFTPAGYSGLPGLPFPGNPARYPAKDDVAEYLEMYSAHFGLPVSLRERVERLEQQPGGFRATSSSGARYEAPQVVVATGPFQRAATPAFASRLAADIVQIHSAEYRNPDQLPNGSVLVVGAGNSGLQIATELAATRTVTLSAGGPATELPTSLLGRSIFWWLQATGAMSVPVTTALGRRASRRQIIIGDGPRTVARTHGVRLASRVIGATGAGLELSSGERLRPSSVVWATGFRPDYRWIQVPVLDRAGHPVHRRGVTAVPGLYFLGSSWLHTRGSALIGWVGRDARFLAGRIRERHRPRANPGETVAGSTPDSGSGQRQYGPAASRTHVAAP